MSAPSPCSLTVLHAHNGRRLAKAFSVATNGMVRKDDFDCAKWFTVETRSVASIDDLHAVLRSLESNPHACVIRGALREGVDPQPLRRRKNGATAPFEEVPREWLMLDIDGTLRLPPGMSILDDPEAAAQHVVEAVACCAPELEDTTAAVQFSSSAALDEVQQAEESIGLPPRWRGVIKPGVSAHVWFWLTEAIGEAELSRWIEAVKAHGLTCDGRMGNTVQPHYTAAPVFNAPLRDPLAGRRTALVRGLQDAATLRVPAPRKWRRSDNGEGARTAHAGRGYAGYLDDIGGPDGFRAPIMRAVASFVATNWPCVDVAALKSDLRARILAADPSPRPMEQIERYASDAHLDDMIAWALRQETEKRARQQAEAERPIDPTFPDRGVTLEEGQRLAAQALAWFQEKLRAGEAPELLVRMTVGGGKSEAAVVGINDLGEAARVGGREGTPYYAVPRHDLGDEMLARLRWAHPGLKFAVWRGMDQPDPDAPAGSGVAMCRDRELSSAAQAAYQSATAACSVCEAQSVCGYPAQRRLAPDVWVVPHNLLFQQKPAELPKPAVIIVDESFIGAAVRGMDVRHPVQLAVSALSDDRTGPVTGLTRERLLFLRKRARDAISQQQDDGGLLRGPFMERGFATESLGHTLTDTVSEWLALEWAAKPIVKVSDGMDRGAAVAAFEAAREQGFTALRPALAQYVRTMLEADTTRAVNVTLHHNAPLGRDQGTGDVVRFQWREPFAAWASEAPKLFLDATAHENVVRIWAPSLAVCDIEITAPHQYARQIIGAQFGRSRFTSHPRNVRRLADLVVTELASTSGAVLVIAQAVVEGLLRKELKRRFRGVPPRLHLAHFGAVTGLDRWREVDRIIVVGRPATNRIDGEWLAEVLKGAPVEMVADGEAARWPTVEAGIRMRDGTGCLVRQPRHPDPIVEAMRWSVTEGAVLQAIGRARGVRRSADRPVHLTLMGELALPLTVDEVVPWDSAQPDRLDVAAAEAALAGRALPLAPADLYRVRPDLWPSEQAVEKDLQRRKGGQTLMGGIYKGLSPLSGQRATRYRKQGGRGTPAVALVPKEGAQAALEAALGPLSFFEPVAPAAPAQPRESVRQGPMPTTGHGTADPPRPKPPSQLPSPRASLETGSASCRSMSRQGDPPHRR